MDLSQVFGLTEKSPPTKKLLCYCLDKLVIALLVAVVGGSLLFAVQHNVEANEENAAKKEASDKVAATKIYSFAEEIADGSIDMDNGINNADINAMEAAYDKQRRAIQKLVIESDMNSEAFEPYQSEIERCQTAMNNFIEVVAKIKDAGGLIGNQAEEFLDGQKEILASCAALSNKCSEIMYSTE